jgi:hypothetical protein
VPDPISVRSAASTASRQRSRSPRISSIRTCSRSSRGERGCGRQREGRGFRS